MFHSNKVEAVLNILADKKEKERKKLSKIDSDYSIRKTIVNNGRYKCLTYINEAKSEALNGNSQYGGLRSCRLKKVTQHLQMNKKRRRGECVLSVNNRQEKKIKHPQ